MVGCLSKTSKLILEASIRNSTKKKYDVYIKKWENYCISNEINNDEITANHIINFLSNMFDENDSYSAIKTAKAAISHKICLPPYRNIGNHPLIVKFMKGVFNLRPPTTKTGFIWDVKLLFDYFDKLPSNDQMSFYDLTCKTLCLLLLLTGSRVNTVFNFCINEIVINDIGITVTPSAVLKHSRQNRKGDIFLYKAFPSNAKLCVVNALQSYIKARNILIEDTEKKLFITTKRPYKAASIDTLRRWIKSTLNKAGIYNFSSHSCRSASTSKALALNVQLEEILKMACWSNVKTFKKHYEKDIIDTDESVNFNNIISL